MLTVVFGDNSPLVNIDVNQFPSFFNTIGHLVENSLTISVVYITFVSNL